MDQPTLQDRVIHPFLIRPTTSSDNGEMFVGREVRRHFREVSVDCSVTWLDGWRGG